MSSLCVTLRNGTMPMHGGRSAGLITLIASPVSFMTPVSVPPVMIQARALRAALMRPSLNISSRSAERLRSAAPPVMDRRTDGSSSFQTFEQISPTWLISSAESSTTNFEGTAESLWSTKSSVPNGKGLSQSHSLLTCQ